MSYLHSTLSYENRTDHYDVCDSIEVPINDMFNYETNIPIVKLNKLDNTTYLYNTLTRIVNIFYFLKNKDVAKDINTAWADYINSDFNDIKTIFLEEITLFVGYYLSLKFGDSYKIAFFQTGEEILNYFPIFINFTSSNQIVVTINHSKILEVINCFCALNYLSCNCITIGEKSYYEKDNKRMTAEQVKNAIHFKSLQLASNYLQCDDTMPRCMEPPVKKRKRYVGGMNQRQLNYIEADLSKQLQSNIAQVWDYRSFKHELKLLILFHITNSLEISVENLYKEVYKEASPSRSKYSRPVITVNTVGERTINVSQGSFKLKETEIKS